MVFAISVFLLVDNWVRDHQKPRCAQARIHDPISSLAPPSPRLPEQKPAAEPRNPAAR